MMRILTLLSLALLVVIAVGCSDDESPTSPGGNTVSFADSTWYDAAANLYRTQIDGSSYDAPAYFSFDSSAIKAPVWDISFMRTNINLNGGASSDGGGTAVGAYLDGVGFDNVTIADTAGLTWIEDEVNYVVGEDWLVYNPQTHQLDMTQYVYTMVDAEGDNYVKFRIDSLVGAGQPPSMGTVWISYYYQATPNSTTLNGAIQTASINVGSGTGYFDFSSGQAVTPASPSTSTGWDLMFHSYNVGTNSGPNGPGDCAAFPAWGEMNDPADISSLASQPTGAPMFADYIKSAFNGLLTDDLSQWYDYNPTTHQIAARDRVYIIKSAEGKFFKLQIDSYYAEIGGVPTSGHFTFKWKPL